MALNKLKTRSRPMTSTVKRRSLSFQGTDKETAGTPSWRTNKTSSTQRGYGYKWQKARLRFLTENPLCCYCQEQGRVTPATVVDHKIPHQGDQDLFWSRDNWQPLCTSCHSGAKQREEVKVNKFGLRIN